MRGFKRSILSAVALATLAVPGVSALEAVIGSQATTPSAIAQQCSGAYSYTQFEERNPSYGAWSDTGRTDGNLKEQSRTYSYTSYAQDYDTNGCKLGAARYNGQQTTTQTRWVSRW